MRESIKRLKKTIKSRYSRIPKCRYKLKDSGGIALRYPKGTHIWQATTLAQHTPATICINKALPTAILIDPYKAKFALLKKPAASVEKVMNKGVNVNA